MIHPSTPPTTRRSRPGSVRTAGVLLAVLAGIATVPATALAASWGPRYSYYSGIRRVTGTGTFTRYSTGSRSRVQACDNYNEGWPVYGYSDWTDIGNSGAWTTRSTGETSGCITGDWTIGWWNPNGFFVRAEACAQVGWPVPDNCTAWVAEAHRP